MNSSRHLVLSILLIGLVLLNGCGGGMSKYMRLAPPGTDYRPGDHQAVVIFLRLPADYPGHHSSVFELTPMEDKLVGILSEGTKVAYVTSPGEHTFMALGYRANFLKARLDGGKTYYVLLTPYFEAVKPDYTLMPAKGKDLAADRFKKSVEGCAYVENTPSSYDWAQHNATSIEAKKRISLPKWERLPDAGRPVLAPEDGV
jgi:hypothetical protein